MENRKKLWFQFGSELVAHEVTQEELDKLLEEIKKIADGGKAPVVRTTVLTEDGRRVVVCADDLFADSGDVRFKWKHGRTGV